uniref:Ribosomal protein L23 n=1 Tax=Nitzschia sp. PL1-4 TaxID=2083272 RepID=A0A2Z5ZAS1_9STRA|nr:ribosomal protein L23 [Nitzschia sp. PL1-4]
MSIPTKLEKIKYPYITSKTRQYIFVNQKKGQKYCLLVNSSMNKKDIKINIESFFNIAITKINLIKIPYKKIGNGKNSGYKKNYKKVIIELKKAQSLKYFQHI